MNTHTPWTHTRSSGQPFMLRHPGSSWGFGVLLKDTSVVVLRVERALYIHSPHLQFLPARDSNPWPLGYESDSLTIRPRLPCILYYNVFCERNLGLLYFCLPIIANTRPLQQVISKCSLRNNDRALWFLWCRKCKQNRGIHKKNQRGMSQNLANIECMNQK